MQSRFSYRGSNERNFSAEFGKFTQAEFYDGEYTIDGGGAFDVDLDNIVDYPINITVFRTRSGIAFRRTWNHIRRNTAAIHVLVIVNAGRLEYTNSNGTTRIEAGTGAIYDVSKPHVCKSHLDETGRHESILINIPSHILGAIARLPAGWIVNFSAMTGDGRVLSRILKFMIDELGSANIDIIQSMIGPCLLAIEKCISANDPHIFPKSMIDRRYDDIIRYINRNIADEHLSVSAIATGCGISERYVCRVLNAKGVTYNQLVWDRRLTIARDWLGDREISNISIGDLARRAGFKSACHFSRVFKKVFHHTPTEFRRNAQRDLDSRTIQ